jgi:hypothetical protein
MWEPRRLTTLWASMACYSDRFTVTSFTSQETHYVSITKRNRLMLFREIIAVYCGNDMRQANKGNTSDFVLRFFRTFIFIIIIIFWFLGVGWDHLVRRPLTGLLYQPRMIDDECGAVGGMRIGKENRSILRKPAPVPLCPPQIPHNPTWARSRRLITWAMARSSHV